MQFKELRTFRRAKRIDKTKRSGKMRNGLSVSTRERRLLRGPRGVLEDCLHILCVRGMMHELRDVGILLDEAPQNALMKLSGTRAWGRAFDREPPQLMAMDKRLTLNIHHL